MKYLVILLFMSTLCSCSFIRSVTKKRTSDSRTSDSLSVTKSSETNAVKKDSSVTESGKKSTKTDFNFVIDTNRKAPVVNNYITPALTGNQGFDMMRWMIANGYIKSGSINMQDDSTYSRIARLVLATLDQKNKNDSTLLHNELQSQTSSKDTDKTIKWQWWQILLLIASILGVWELLKWLKTRYKITKIIKDVTS